MPKEFKDRVSVLHKAMREARLGTLVTLGPDGIEASHIPMLVDPEPQPFGTLRGHISRANPQWRRASPIARLEGKWKMSQNRPAADRAGVVAGLTAEGGAGEAAVAEIVAKAART